MFHTTMDNAWAERSIKPLYAKTQATAQDWTLAATDIAAGTLRPGNIVTATADSNGEPVVTACNATAKPLGFIATFVGGISDEVVIGEGTKTSVWVLDPDALFFVSKDVCDNEGLATAAIGDLLGSNANAKLTKLTGNTIDPSLAVAKLNKKTDMGYVIAGLSPQDVVVSA